MEALFGDELFQEIFQRVPSQSSAAVSLVSRRWRRLLRSSTASLSVHFPPPYNPTTVTSFSAFLCQHPFLSSLSVAASGGGAPVLLAVAASCPNLRDLRLSGPPLSTFSLFSISVSCVYLCSISIAISRPLNFHWLPQFKSLKHLSLSLTNPSESDDFEKEPKDGIFDADLNLESLSVSGILPGDYGVKYLWRNCKKIKKLQLKSCESVGDYPSFSEFLTFSTNLQELELRTCRSIVVLVLLTLPNNSLSLESLLIHDGGSREVLLHFLNQTNCTLKKLDLRLPLDLDNTHLIVLSENSNFRGLTTLRLQSCCLVNGEGLLSLGRALGSRLEELALVNCDVVERESGLLANLGQSLRGLRKLDLSYNDMLLDKELVSMLVSCDCLVELKLRGCGRLTSFVTGLMVRRCKMLQNVDISYCHSFDMEGVEVFVLSCLRLRRLEVEGSKVSEAARMWASNKFIEVVSC